MTLELRLQTAARTTVTIPLKKVRNALAKDVAAALKKKADTAPASRKARAKDRNTIRKRQKAYPLERTN
jgi:hypothetical protein